MDEIRGKKGVGFLWHDMAQYSSSSFLKSYGGDPFLSIYLLFPLRLAILSLNRQPYLLIK